MAEHKWFCDDPEGEGITGHATEKEALARAALCIDAWIDGGEDWPEEVQEITVGCVTHRAQQSNIQRPNGPLDEDGYDQDGVHWQGPDDYRCDYIMQGMGTLPQGEVV